MLCQFDSSNRCPRCGRVNRSGVPTLQANCAEPVPCPHLGDPVGTVKVDCLTCGGITQLDYVACKCAAFGPLGRCLPAYVPPDPAAWKERPESQLYQLCHGCERRPSA